jgi:hypothetical protein
LPSLHPTLQFRLRSLLRASALLVTLALALSIAAPAAAIGPIAHYVDCSAGNDAWVGTSTTSAWRSLTRANQATLAAGDSLLLKRGCTWTGPLNVRWSGTSTLPILVGAYGTGALPRIQNSHENVLISGSNVIVENVFTRSDPVTFDSGCQNQPAGWRVGFRLVSGASYDTIRASEADDQYVGIMIEGGAHHNRVLSNTLRNNNMKDPNFASDAGAVGISLMGNDNEVAYNAISGSDTCSELYGRDGAAVEVFGGSRNRIHHNVATQNNNFTELGKVPSSDNTYAYNKVTSSLATANFLVTRGASTSYGPVYRTKVFNNVVYLSGSQAYAVQCTGGCISSILSMRGNIIWSQDRVGYADAAFDEGNNLYWKSDGAPKVWFPISSTSRKADPRFVDLAASNLRLQSTSPAINTGGVAALNLGYVLDLDGVALPQGAAPDMGAYEAGGSSSSSITASIADRFGRTTTGGWGVADLGGAYTLVGSAADYATGNGVGTVRLAAAATGRGALLPGGVSATNLDVSARISRSAVATGGGEFAYLVARRIDASTEYRAKVRFAADGGVYLQPTRVTGGVETSLGSGEVRVTGLTPVVGSFIWLHATFSGTNPTAITLRAWADGSPEPATAQVSLTDGTAALQAPGTVGLRAYLSASATNAPVTMTFDDITAR